MTKQTKEQKSKDHQEKIQEQINLAKNVDSCGLTTIIKTTKLSARSRKFIYGFSFVKAGSVSICDIIENEDGSISKVEEIIEPPCIVEYKKEIKLKAIKEVESLLNKNKKRKITKSEKPSR